MKKLLKAPEGSAQQGFHLVSFGQDENLVIINQYSEKLYLINKEKFLVKVSRRSSWNSVGSEDEKLADFLVSKYDNAHLKSYFSKNSFGFGSYAFSSLVLKKLK